MRCLAVILFFFFKQKTAYEITYGDWSSDVRSPELGWLVIIGMFLKAYSLGAGTYTGIEAVSNSMAVMREPRVATAQRTMLYMAVSLAITAGGLMLAYLLFELDLKKAGSSLLEERVATGRTM